jgi:hypothetical protein
MTPARTIAAGSRYLTLKRSRFLVASLWGETAQPAVAP